MKILWAIANWKRTGPVEPSLDLAAALSRRGHEVLVVTGRPVGTAPDEAGEAAEARGLHRLALGLRLCKHRRWLSNRRDAALLARHLAARPPDLVVCTLANDHRIASAALARAGTSAGAPVARLWFEDGSAPPARGEAALLRRAARVFAFGHRPEATLRGAGIPPASIVRLDPPLDVDRLRRLSPGREAARARWGAAPGEALFGIVARVQAHRRFDLLWDAVGRLRARGVRFRLLVVGRGTRFEGLARGPVERSGLGDVVRWPGYLRGDEYASVLAALDAQVFLVPGSDPTCRALREGMALGVPSVATRRGLLPDLVVDGETGLLVDEDPDALAAALSRLAADPSLRARLAAGAAASAEARFALPRVAERMEAGWEGVRAGRPRQDAAAAR